MLHYKTCDLFEAPADFYCHQVNCQGVMGAGLAKTIRSRYPEVFETYRHICIKYERSVQLLGKVQVVRTYDGKNIINLFGQFRYGVDRQHTDYKALESAFNTLNTYCKGRSIAIPYKMGCGLGGGDWKIVEDIIRNTLQDCTVYICKRI